MFIQNKADLLHTHVIFVASQKPEADCAWATWCDLRRDVYFHPGVSIMSTGTTSVFPRLGSGDHFPWLPPSTLSKPLRSQVFLFMLILYSFCQPLLPHPEQGAQIEQHF